MAPRAKTPGSRAPPAARAEDVLAGRARPDARGLARLVREVNPSGRELPRAEEAARYSQKARLQSLLVDRFASELEVVPEPERPGVVLLRLRGGDASHAVVAQLEPDARAWVQLQLDLAQAGPAEAEPPLPRSPQQGTARAGPRPGGSADPDGSELDREAPAGAAAATGVAGLLAAGREALAAYDYDAARTQLEAALRASGGEAEPAAALLGLLVETLAADEEALLVEARLSRRAAGSDEIRSLLALAAARTGDQERALRLTQGCESPRVGEVLAILGDAALRGGRPADARRLVGLARHRGAAGPELARIEEEARREESTARRPAEEELARRLAGGETGEARRLAEELLARAPGSRVAREALERLEADRRSAGARQALDLGAAALASGDPEAAAAHLRHAAALGAPPDELRPKLADAGAQLRERAIAAQVEGVLARLEPVSADGLLAFLSLPPEARELVRRRRDLAPLGWLSELDPPAEGARARAAADAVLSLHRAAAALERGEAEKALELLARHEPQLGRLAAGRLLLERAREAAAAVALARADGALEAADAALDRDDLDGAERALASAALDRAAEVAGTELPGRLSRLRAELRTRRELAQIEALLGAGEALAARALAKDLAPAPTGGEATRTALLARISAGVRRQCRVQVVRRPEGETGLAAASAELGLYQDSAATWLSPDGRQVALALARANRLFLWILDVRSGTPELVASLRPPDRLTFVRLVRDGEALWVVSDSGGLLRLSLPAVEPELARSISGLLEPGEILEETCPVPGTGLVWLLTSRRPHGEGRTAIYNLERGRIVRSMGEIGALQLVPGGTEPVLARRGDEGGLQLHAPQGAALPGGSLLPDRRVEAVAPHPRGEGWVALAGVPGGGDFLEESADSSLELVELDVGGTLEVRHRLDGSLGVTSSLAAATTSGSVFVRSGGEDGESRLSAFRLEGRQLVASYTAPVDSGAVLAIDERSRYAALLRATLRGLDVTPLGGAPPREVDEAARTVLPPVSPTFFCAPGAGDPAFVRSLAAVPPERREAEPARRLEACGGPDEVAALVAGLQSAGWDDEAALVARLGVGRYPRSAAVRLAAAGALAGVRSFAEVRDLLGSCDPAALEPAERDHRAHLEGLALLELGDAEGARRVWLDWGVLGDGAPDDPCSLKACVELVQPLPPPSEGEPVVYTVRRTVAAADRALDEGDAAAALGILDVPAVWRAHECQSLARLAEAWLALEPAPGAAGFRKTLALASFLEANEENYRRDLPLPGRRYGRERLDAIAARAAAWLEAEGAE